MQVKEARQHGSPYLPVCHIRPLYVPLFMRSCIEAEGIAGAAVIEGLANGDVEVVAAVIGHAAGRGSDGDQLFPGGGRAVAEPIDVHGIDGDRKSVVYGKSVDLYGR